MSQRRPRDHTPPRSGALDSQSPSKSHADSASGYESSTQTGWPNLAAVCRLNIGFFLVFLSFLTTQNMMPMLIGHLGFGQLGFYSLMVLYIFFGFSCGPIPPLLKCMSPRRMLPIAALPFTIYELCVALVSSDVLPTSVAAACLLSASAFVGVGAACLWTCQGVIMTHYAPPELLNKYVAFFLLCWQSATVIGPLLTKVLLARMTTSKVFMLLAGVCCTGATWLARLPAPETNADTPPEPLVVATPLHQVVVEARTRLAQPILLLRRDRRAVHIAILSFTHGMGINSVPSAVLPSVVRAGLDSAAGQELAREHMARALMFIGFGNVLAALSFAPLADRLGRRAVICCLSASLASAAILFELEALRVYSIHPKIAYVDIAALLLGFANISCRGSLNSLVLSIYKADSVKAVVLMQVCIAFGTVLGFVILPQMSLRMCFVLAIGGYALSGFAAGMHGPLFYRLAESKDK